MTATLESLPDGRHVALPSGVDAFWVPRSVPLETRTNKVLAMAIGTLLALLTMKTGYTGTSLELYHRVAPVDLICVALLGVLFLRHRMKALPLPSCLYVSAVVLSLIPGIASTGLPDSHLWVSFAALLMAFGFYVVGLNVGASPDLLKWLLAGLCVGVFAESIVVLHDAVASTQWFPDPMDGRVRGTFKANGQLGAYGFCAAGLLVTFGSTTGSRRFRAACIVASLMAASFVFLASRRTGMVAVFAWGVMFAFLARGFARERFYRRFVAAFAALILLIAACWAQVSSSFAGQRFTSAMESMSRPQGFIQNQLWDSLATADRWFPFGFGAGMGSLINFREAYEIHNGLLAVLVELGVLGLAGFLGMVVLPLLRRHWRRRSPGHELLCVLLTTTLFATFIFMFHNTLFRDRTFLLFLGAATAIVHRESRLGAGREAVA